MSENAAPSEEIQKKFFRTYLRNHFLQYGSKAQDIKMLCPDNKVATGQADKFELSEVWDTTNDEDNNSPICIDHTSLKSSYDMTDDSNRVLYSNQFSFNYYAWKGHFGADYMDFRGNRDEFIETLGPGPLTIDKLAAWTDIIDSLPSQADFLEEDIVHEVHIFFNAVITPTGDIYYTDKKSTEVKDPLTAIKEGGDCDDYVFAKYMALRELGIPEERMRMAVVNTEGRQKLDTDGIITPNNIDHIVLLVTLDDGRELMLDNLNKNVIDYKAEIDASLYDGAFRSPLNYTFHHIFSIAGEGQLITYLDPKLAILEGAMSFEKAGFSSPDEIKIASLFAETDDLPLEFFNSNKRDTTPNVNIFTFH